MDKVRALLDHVTPLDLARSDVDDPRRPAHGQSATAATLAAGRAHSARRSSTRLLQDLRDTMAATNGAGLAAPQIGVLLQVVIFGVEHNERYPDAEPVPYTELINPVLTPLADDDRRGLGGLPVGARAARHRAALHAAALRGIRSARPSDPPRGRRLPRARRPARVRPPAGHPLSDADARSVAVRLHRHHLSRTARADDE